ncbi:MAG: hypothetical protein COW55_16065 [Rhodobacteraceae bacterium CG17_big_fil_post_rev_8_21_14_2_50_65_11]|nr:MAG: hypothetical protein COW55_16065 [Rhodobacteraceae bacterium CG17_big_fil_post_rev_8_21_14_2_50_65_11]
MPRPVTTPGRACLPPGRPLQRCNTRKRIVLSGRGVRGSVTPERQPRQALPSPESLTGIVQRPCPVKIVMQLRRKTRAGPWKGSDTQKTGDTQMSIKKTLMLGALIPVAIAVSLPVAAMGPIGEQGHARPAFADLDADGDGQLTQEEMMAHRNARFAEADTDGDGSLDRDEMIAASAARIEERIDRMMARIDEDGDGLISAGEMAAMGPRGQGPEQMFTMLDSDGDGTISAAEFDEMSGGLMQRGGGHGEARGHGMQDGEGWGRHGGGQGHGQGQGQGRGWSDNG